MAQTFADKVDAFINAAWDKGLTVYVSRPMAAAKVRALPREDRHLALRRDSAGDILFGARKVWKLCPADHITAR